MPKTNSRHTHQKNLVELEDIDEMRRVQGIDDVKLREEIRALHAGNLVKLTFLSPTPVPAVSETLLVRITSSKGRAFRGKLVRSPASPRLSSLHAGSLVAFTDAHIHSLGREEPECGSAK
jgi:hypothetical protein